MASGIEYVGAGVLLVAALVWGAISNKRSAAAAQFRAEREFAESQQLVVRLLRGDEPALFRETLHAPGLRPVQIIGESIQLVLTTKNEATRRSRLDTIQWSVRQLEESRWLGLTDDSRERVLEAVAVSRETGIALAAIAAAHRHIRVAQRATRQPTREKYIRLALEPVEEALAILTLDSTRAGVVELRDELQGYFDGN